MCHSLWYFATRETVAQLFGALDAAANVLRVCVAEYTGTARTSDQVPHELAAKAQRLLHQLRKPREAEDISAANVREALEPSELMDLAKKAGWTVEKKGVVEAPDKMYDGSWEVAAVRATSFKEAVLAEKLDQKDETELLDYIAKVEKSTGDLKNDGGKVKTMDVAWFVLSR
jgi:hypothetical protein